MWYGAVLSGSRGVANFYIGTQRGCVEGSVQFTTPVSKITTFSQKNIPPHPFYDRRW